MNNCTAVSSKKLWVFKENRSKLTLENQDSVQSICTRVDGCAINKGIRCDYLHVAKEVEMYIELKGQDIPHATKQIEATIRQLNQNGVERGPKRGYIICPRSPLASPQIQQLARDFKKKCKSLARSHSGQKRSIFVHASPFFSSDALHRTQKSGSPGQKYPLF